ncbi:MAG: alcohol dehydrogenase catalytic domain-containing protein, partial [Chloroflexota bacterium]|nr:alcohol dehydrogenase catalytic domain-containing protein [Chloroflexota bacterium]
MKALRYRFSIPNHLAVRALDRALPALLAAGRIPGLALVDAVPRPLPGGEWLRLRPRLCGVCGSDVSLLTNRGSPALTPFVSFPLVPGHEVVADVVAVGPAVAGIAPGERVVVDPLISCRMRGLEPCPPCARGESGLCTRAAEGRLAQGMLTGFCRDLPGGWGEEMVAHRSQVYPVPADMPDEVAALVEPLSVALHAVLRCPPGPRSRVLVVGGGTVGLLVLSALRLLGSPCHVTLLARHRVQADLAARLGADLV